MAERNIQFSFGSKTVIVTGGGQGLGRSVALAFAEAGANVVVADIHLAKAREVLAEVTARHAQGIALEIDVSITESIAGLVAKTVDSFGTVDVLVNNAGIVHRGDIFSITDQEWDRLMAVNLRGVWVCSREVLRVMLRQGNGRVVNVGSISGWLGGHEVGADYAASKAGVAVLTKRMANEVASKGITVNSVAPHALETPMTEGHGEKGIQRILAKIPVGRLGKTEEIAAVVLFLASAEAAYITGQTIHANGGALMVY